MPESTPPKPPRSTRFRALAALLPALVLAAGALRAEAPEPKIAESAARQIAVLQGIKTAKSTAQQKIDSRLYMAILNQRKDPRLTALPDYRYVLPDADGRMEIDISTRSADNVKPVMAAVRAAGGEVVVFHLEGRMVRARVPLAAVEGLAGTEGVRKIRFPQKSWRSAVNVSEGDVAHRAAEARNFFGVNGAGVKLCALSDGVDALPAQQASGDLPAVDVLPGQAGSGNEGSAMLEILHDLAPGAALGFATADPTQTQFAANIRGLAAAGCNIIVDDIIYFAESPFQDSEVTDAVDEVTAAGVLYFSSTGNEGNANDGTSGTWEGDFNPNGTIATLPGGATAGTVHNFGDGGQSQLVTAGSAVVTLHWNDVFGASANDYDLYDMNNALTTVFDSSTDGQDGDDDPVEVMGGSFTNERLVVALFSGVGRMINLNNFRGRVARQTPGCTRGHSAAANAFSVAAVDVATAGGSSFTGGAGNPVEPFSCDGPRRIFFDFAGNLLPGAPAGNLTATGGVIRQKPDIAAADGVATSSPGFNPFFGTSAAAPHAAAIAGLIKAALPSFTPAQIRTALTSSALDIEGPGVDRDSGAGIVMAYQALQASGATPQAFLTAGTVATTQIAGDGDAFVETGEDWGVTVPLTNSGGATATAISAVLTSSTPGVVILDGNSTYGDLAPGATGTDSTSANLPAGVSGGSTAPFAFTTTSAVPCGATLSFTLTVSYTGGSQSPQTFPFTLQVGSPGAPMTFSYTGPPVPIADGSGGVAGPPAIANLLVAGVPGNIYDVNLRIDGSACSTTSGSTTVGIDHTFVSDLDVLLRAPSTSTALVIDNADGSGHNFCQTVLDDQSAGPGIQTVVTANAPFTGSFKPNEALSAFSAQPANGTWQLQVEDFFALDTGNIRAFSLIITPAVCDAPALTSNVTATKVVSGSFTPGGTVTYTITLRNTGTGTQPDNAGNEFTDTLPAQLTVGTPTASSGTVSGAGVNPVTWNGSIPPGGTVTLTIPATIQAGTSGQTVTNQGTVSFDANRDFSNDTTGQTDDPGTAPATDPTTFVVSGSVLEIPTLSEVGLALLVLMLSAAALTVLRRRS